MRRASVLRVRQRLGKYRIEKRIAAGGFAAVYQAMDTIEGIRVALKVPHADILTEDVLSDFRKEARLTAKLDHPNILPLKNASFIDDRFVIVFPLGERSLAERLTKRIALTSALDLAEQLLEAVAYAHGQRIIHCDIKPENVILFADGRLRLTDFGIAKVAMKRLQGSGTGTVGYMAPEQAMGRPTYRSDVFSMGLLFYRMFSGQWPEWPYDWPPPGIKRLRTRVHPDMVTFLRRSIQPDPRKRFRDAVQMQTAFTRVKLLTIKHAARRR